MRSVVGVNASRPIRPRADLLTLLAKDSRRRAVVNDGFSHGGQGAIELAEAVLGATPERQPLRAALPADTPIPRADPDAGRRIYGAADVEFLPECQKRIDWLTERGMGTLPVCMSKTHLSLSHDPALKGRPRGFTLPVRNVYPSPARLRGRASRRHPADARPGKRAGLHSHRYRGGMELSGADLTSVGSGRPL